MAGIGGSHYEAFYSDGIGHTVNPGRANSGSITLGTDAGLDATSARWNGMSPHSVLATTMGSGSQDDGSWERFQRDAGSYQPGAMPEMTDQLGSGTNDDTP